MRQPVGKRPCGLKRTLESPTTFLVGAARQKIIADDLLPLAEVRVLRRCVGPRCRVLRAANQLETDQSSTIMNQPKRHHYIPVMLLNRFTDDDGGLWLCRRAGKETKIQLVSPKNAFVEGHLYTKRDGSGNPDMSVEAGLSAVEGDASPVIDRIVDHSLAGHCPCLSALDRQNLVQFMICLRRRDPGNRQWVEKTLDPLMAEFLDRFEIDAGRSATEAERSQIKEVHQNAFASFAGARPRDDIVSAYSRFPILFGVIRLPRRSFVVGNQIGPPNWFPVHRQVALRLEIRNGPDELIDFTEMADVGRINEQTARHSMTFAGPSERLVRSLAGLK